MVNPSILLPSFLIGLAVFGSPAAAETTKAFALTATVVNGCVIASNGGSNWGTIDLGTLPGTAGATADASLVSAGGAGIAIECTPGVTAAIAADGGDNAAAGTRYLKRSSGNQKIAYRLFANGSNAEWTTGTISLPFTSATGQRLVPLRAVATLSGPTAAGTYTDTLRITLTW